MKRFHILNTLFNLTGELCPPTPPPKTPDLPPFWGAAPPPPSRPPLTAETHLYACLVDFFSNCPRYVR